MIGPKSQPSYVWQSVVGIGNLLSAPLPAGLVLADVAGSGVAALFCPCSPAWPAGRPPTHDTHILDPRHARGPHRCIYRWRPRPLIVHLHGRRRRAHAGAANLRQDWLDLFIMPPSSTPTSPDLHPSRLPACPVMLCTRRLPGQASPHIGGCLCRAASGARAVAAGIVPITPLTLQFALITQRPAPHSHHDRRSCISAVRYLCCPPRGIKSAGDAGGELAFASTGQAPPACLLSGLQHVPPAASTTPSLRSSAPHRPGAAPLPLPPKIARKVGGVSWPGGDGRVACLPLSVRTHAGIRPTTCACYVALRR